MNKIISFGDSWTAGDCSDLIENNLQEFDHTVCTLNNHNSVVFKTPWPVIVANKLKIDIENKAIPGNNNKAITTQLYDQYIFSNYNKNDLVIVALSTWHREYQWLEEESYKYNKLIYPESSSYYASKFPNHDDSNTVVIDNLNKIAYDSFFDFFTIKNFLENLGLRFYITWAFTMIDDFAPFLNSKYVDIIKNTKNILEPMINYCNIMHNGN